jgi:stage II sporulation protein R
MKLKKWELALIAALLFTFILGAGLRREQTDLSEKLIRLHVVANSDSEADQALKLKVRDGILKEVGRLLEGVTDRGEAVRLIEENLDTVTAGARDVVLQNGYGYEVTATIAVEAFPTREYETFSLPAGEYTSLRVVIGEGGGHNWWCVIFPPLCLSVASDAEDIFEQLTPEEIRLITEDGPEYVLKFKALELIEKLKELLGL